MKGRTRIAAIGVIAAAAVLVGGVALTRTLMVPAALATDAAGYLAIGDARRETFYFTRVEDGVCVEGPLLATEAELLERIAAHAELPVFASTPLSSFPTAQIALPSAARLARLADAARGITATGDLEPIYLREPHITLPKHASAVAASG